MHTTRPKPRWQQKEWRLLSTFSFSASPRFQALRLVPFGMSSSLHRGCVGPVRRRPHPVGDGPADLVRRIFLDEMDPRDGDLGLRWPRADGVEIRAAAEERTGLGLYEQFGHITRRQPVRIGSHDRVNVRGFALDRDLPRPRQCRPSALAGEWRRYSALSSALGGRGA